MRPHLPCGWSGDNGECQGGYVVSSGLPSMVVADIYTPYITCDVDEMKLPRIKLDQEVDISLAALGKDRFKGKVVRINKEADFATKKASKWKVRKKWLGYFWAF